MLELPGRQYDFEGVDGALDLLNLNDASINRVLEEKHGRNMISKTIEEKRGPVMDGSTAAAGTQ